MIIKKTNLEKVFKIYKNYKKDLRGLFYRDFCEKNFKKNLKFNLKQVNFSFNKKKYTLRGFHYQKYPYGEDKIIKCLKGKIYNVVVNINKKSPEFLKKQVFIISQKTNYSLYINKNYANAFLTLEDNTEVLYYMSNFYNPKKSAGFRYDDPKLKIKWPFIPKIISKKDLKFKNI